MAVCVRCRCGQRGCAGIITVKSEFRSCQSLLALLGLCGLICISYRICLYISGIAILISDLVEFVGLCTFMLFAIFGLFRIGQGVDTEGVMISGIRDCSGLGAVCRIVRVLDLSSILILVIVLGIVRVAQGRLIGNDDLSVAIGLDIILFQSNCKCLGAVSAAKGVICTCRQCLTAAVYDTQIRNRVKSIIQCIADLKDAGIINGRIGSRRLTAFFGSFRYSRSCIRRDRGFDLKSNGVSSRIGVAILCVYSITFDFRTVVQNDCFFNCRSRALGIGHISIGELCLGINRSCINRA